MIFCVRDISGAAANMAREAISNLQRSHSCTGNGFASPTPVLILILLLAFSSPVLSVPRDVPMLDGDIVLDGVIDESAWRNAMAVNLSVETEPGNNIPTKFTTKAYLLQSAQHLYIAFDAKGDPGEIRSHIRTRDRIGPDDQVGVVIDAFADRSRAYMFFMSPGGVIYDALYHELSGNEESGWDGDWLSQARVQSDGYQAEFRIPFNIMTLPGSRRVPMAIDLVRMIPRQERHRLSYIALQRGNNCYLCQLKTFWVWPEVKSRDKTQVTLSQTLGAERTAINGNDWESGEDTNNQSLEISRQTSHNGLLSLAINPDFSQVELDDLIFDLNQQFSIFVPEKRTFFLQHADFFRTNISLVNTKNILDPLYTARYSHKSKTLEQIYLYAKDRALRLLLPDTSYSSVYLNDDAQGENFAARVRANATPQISLGATGTHRDYQDYGNSMLSTDVKWRPNQYHELNLQWAGSQTRATENELAAVDDYSGENAFGKAYYLRYVHSRSNWDVNFYTGGSSDEFRADMGFMPQNDFRDASVTFRYAHYFADESFLERILLRSEAYTQQTWNGQKLSDFYSQSMTLSGENQFSLTLELGTKIQNYSDQEFKQPYQRVEFSLTPMDAFQMTASAYRGDRIDFANDRLGDTMELDASLTWRLANRLELSAGVNHWQFDSASSSLFTLNGATMYGLYHFSNRAFLRLSVQRRGIKRNINNYLNPYGLGDRDKGTDWQLLFHYSPSNTVTFYAGVTDYSFATELEDVFTEERQYGFAKFSYTFDF